jgi:hypothetical protein
MRNCLSKLREPSNENQTGYLQRYVVLGYERKRKDLNFKTNDRALQMIPRGVTATFIEEIKKFRFLLSEKLGYSNSFQLITHLECA